jgi:outer membrane protein assembly factor BamB
MKTKSLYYSLTLFLLIIMLSGCASGMTPSSWAGVTANSETAYVALASHVYAVQVSNGVELWRYPAKADAKVSFYALPTLTPDGQLIVGGYDRILYSLSPLDGTVNWTFGDAKDRWIGSAAVGNGMIFAPSSDYNLYALDLKGKLLWTFATGQALWAQPVVDSKRVYFGSMDNSVYALDMTPAKPDKPVWSTELDGAILGSLTLDKKGVLYAGTLGGSIYALDSATGKIKWKQSLSSWIWSGAVSNNTGSLFAGDQAGKLFSMAADSGKENWSVQPDGPILGSPLVLDTSIVFGTESGSLVNVGFDNKTIWTKTITGKLYGTPVLAGNLILVAPLGGDATLIAFDLNGVQQWVYTPAK